MLKSGSGFSCLRDPVDGTREFIEERYQNCQCLIGVAHKGKAVVGVVGIPFQGENNQRRR